MPGGNWDRSIPEWTDVFDNQVATRTNVLDIASHYAINPERWTLKVNGTRELTQYGSVSQYNHAGDVHELKPSGGDTVILETAERPRYVVQYELAVTWAFSVNQSLTTGDSILIGFYDGSDGYYMEHDGSHADDEADFVMERDGSEVYRKSNIDLEKAVTTFARLKLSTGWYDITRQEWERSYTDDGTQRNPKLGTFSADGEKGPKVGNLPLRFEVTADSGTSNLQLDAGSCAVVNLGQTTPLKRTKIAVHTDTIDTTGSWVPLRAYRIDPDKSIINVQITGVDIGEYSASDDAELLVQSYDKSNTLDSGGNTLVDSDFSTPNEFTDENNALQTTGAVEQVANNAGTTSTSVSNPGGWQLARAELYDGSGNTVSGVTRTPVGTKRPMYARDHAVVLGKSGTTGDVTYQIQFEQDW